MKKMLRFLATVFLLGIFISFFQPVSAEEINSFNSQIVAHPDGTMNITETIDYDFGDLSRHGIFLDIPKVAKVGELFRVMEFEVKGVIRDGRPETYQDNSDSSKLSLKIGKADQTITGNHIYEISYLVRNGIGSNYDDHDEIYWNVTGNNWPVPINEASVTIISAPVLPGPKMVCYTGTLGSKEQNCTFATDKLNTPVLTTKSLQPGEGLSVVWEFPKGTFPESLLQTKNPIDTGTEIDPATSKMIGTIIVAAVLIIPILLNLILAPILLVWYFKNKHKNRFGPVSVNFDFPKDNQGKRVTPAESGSIDTYLVDQNDVIATIFDLAIRKYLKITQAKSEKVLGIFGKGEDYNFIKLKDLEEDAPAFERVIWDKLFAQRDNISLNSLQVNFYKTFQKFETEVFNSLIDRAFYNKNPKMQMGGLLAGGIMVIFIGGIILGPVLIFLSRKLNGRTMLGDEMDWKIDGLKIFLKNMSREHTWQAKNLITVEKYIPYAIAFGFIKEFMEQLKAIYPDYEPNWYSGNLAFYAISNSMISSMSSNFTTHAPSSSSGFSGGGFSGGGGGGGGGGSW